MNVSPNIRPINTAHVCVPCLVVWLLVVPVSAAVALGAIWGVLK